MIWLLFLGFIVGITLGSFVKAVADRTAEGKNIWGRSCCPHCKHKLRWYDLFPILSYLSTLGKCRWCKKAIAPEYLVVEVAMGMVVALLFALSPQPQTAFGVLDLVFKLFVVTILAVLFLIDLKTGLLPDRITYPASVVAIIYLVLATGLKSLLFYRELAQSPLGLYLMPPHSNYLTTQLQRLWEPVGWSLLAALAVSSFFALLIVITRGKGMGWGDVKYVFFLGLALPFPHSITAVFLSFLLGALFSVALIVLGKKHFGQTIPFGPFLSLGALIALLWGQQILNLYFNLRPF